MKELILFIVVLCYLVIMVGIGNAIKINKMQKLYEEQERERMKKFFKKINMPGEALPEEDEF